MSDDSVTTSQSELSNILADAVRKIKTAPKDTRRNTMYRQSFRVGIHARDLPPVERLAVRAQLVSAGLVHGFDAALVESQVDNGLDAGLEAEDEGVSQLLVLDDLNDARLGRMFAQDPKLGAEIRYVKDESRWINYDGKRWIRLPPGKFPIGALDRPLHELAATYETKALECAADAGGNDDSEDLEKYFKACVKRIKSKLSTAGRRAILQSIEGIPAADAVPMHVHSTELDAHDYLLCAQNGVIDLSQYPPTLRPHSPTFLQTMITRASFDPAARCPRYEKALCDSQQNDEDRAEYVLRVLGRGLIGGLSERFWIAQGSGFNLKGATATPAYRVLGDYAATLSPALLLQTKHPPHSSLSGGLGKVRFLLADELPQSAVFDMGKIKELLSPVGSRKQTGMGENFGDRRVAATLLILCNPMPTFIECEDADRRRVTRMHFRVRAGEELGLVADETWSDRIAAEEGPGILNLLAHHAAKLVAILEGNKRRPQGQHDPHFPRCTQFERDTAEMWQESDPTHSFIAQCCVIEDGAEAPFSEVYSRWTAYASANNLPQLGPKSFRKWVSQQRTSTGRSLVTEERGHFKLTTWIGLRLRSSVDARTTPRPSAPPPN